MTEQAPPTRGPAPPAHEDPDVDTDCLVMARRVRQGGRSSVGLVALEPSIPVLELARLLGDALMALGERVALVGPTSRWRAPADSGERDPVVRADPDRVVEVFPRQVAPARVSAALEQTVSLLRQGFDRVLVDLSGLDVLSEQAAALASVDGVALVGRAGAASELELARFRGVISAGRLLGVILVG